MADFGRGIKAGVAVAGIYIVISLIFAAIGDKFPYFWFHGQDFILAAGLRIPPGLTNPSFLIPWLFGCVFRGVLLGAIFTALYDHLPSVRSVVKGVVLLAFLWIVAVAQIVYTRAGWPWHANGLDFFGSTASGTISLSSVGLALAGIISALVFGALIGFLWDRFRGKESTEARKGSAVLLVSFIYGGLGWTLLAIDFVIRVVIRGAPATGPDFLLWPDILSTSVAFLGLPGWVLTFIAWRKTKRGGSGFKWGLAGGVIMALTGLMLLPGLLAITGGVLSRRKSVPESGTAAIEQ